MCLPHQVANYRLYCPVFMGFGAAFTMNKLPLGYGMLITGLVILAFLIYGWFREVSLESEAGKYKAQEDKSFRWSMGWFIFSEVMFLHHFWCFVLYACAFSTLVSWS